MIAADQLPQMLIELFGDDPPAKPLGLLWATGKLRAGVPFADVLSRIRTTRSRLAALAQASDPASLVLRQGIPLLDDDTERKTRQSLGQLLIGNLAERAFEEIYKETVGTSELRLVDDRGKRGETDYLVLNGQDRQVFRMNIKFHGSLFRRAQELVGLEPENCFPLATYKIHAALNRQDTEHLPYIFVIVGVRGLTGERVGEIVPSDLVHLASLPRVLKIQGVRDLEDRIVEGLIVKPPSSAVDSAINACARDIRRAEWYVLSARRAFLLLRDHLFDRVYALRVRAFARNYARAELDMHFSLSEDLRPLGEFLGVLRDYGMPGLVSRLERGTI